MSGHDLQSLKPYKRCSPNTAAATEPAQSPKPILRILPSPPAQRPDQTVEARIAEWLKTCLADWDRATHMTKPEWRATCKRVEERGGSVAERQAADTLSKTDKIRTALRPAGAWRSRGNRRRRGGAHRSGEAGKN